MEPERRRHTLHRLILFLMEYKWGFGAAFILSVGGNLLALIGPQLSGQAVDVIEKGLAAGHIEFERVVTICLWMLFFYCLSSILTYILSAWMLKISKQISLRLRREVFDRLCHCRSVILTNMRSEI